MTLSERMKSYEEANRSYLTPRTPIAIRVDGKAFHTFTKGLTRPFDDSFEECMLYTLSNLVENIQGCMIGYQQSDEITLILQNYYSYDTSAWFDGQIEKIVSTSSSLATYFFNKRRENFRSDVLTSDMTGKVSNFLNVTKNRIAVFDSRAFSLPKEEVLNNLIWRQNDCERNSVLNVAQSKYSQKQLQNKSCEELKEMLLKDFSYDWDKDTPVIYKYGALYLNGPKDVSEVGLAPSSVKFSTLNKDKNTIKDIVFYETGE
jgi:tRNA(His) guanylyltransferase